MKNKIQIGMRIALSLVLIYFIFKETGMFTAMFAVLILATVELATAWITITNKRIKALEDSK